MYSTSVISNYGISLAMARENIEQCGNCGHQLDITRQRLADEIPCPVCGQVINSKGEIIKDGRDLSLPQIF